MSSASQQVDSDHDADGEYASDGAEGLSPEGYLLVLVLIGAGYVVVRYVGDHYGWYWPWVILPALAGVLLLSAQMSTSPRRQLQRAKRRELAPVEREIAQYGLSMDRMQRRNEIDERYRPLEEEERARRSWRGKPISWPRRILRWFSIGVLVLLLIPMGLVFYGGLLLFPSAVVFFAGYFLIDVWALLPAVLALPAGGWLVWWWVNRVPASTAQAVGLASAAGSV